MTHVFEDEPDERQSDERISVSRFRPRFRALSEEEKSIHDDIKAKAEELEQIFGKVADGRYHSLALTSLEASIMWIIKELTGEGGLRETR